VRSPSTRKSRWANVIPDRSRSYRQGNRHVGQVGHDAECRAECDLRAGHRLKCGDPEKEPYCKTNPKTCMVMLPVLIIGVIVMRCIIGPGMFPKVPRPWARRWVQATAVRRSF
jgi:hypothetical protein